MASKISTRVGASLSGAANLAWCVELDDRGGQHLRPSSRPESYKASFTGVEVVLQGRLLSRGLMTSIAEFQILPFGTVGGRPDHRLEYGVHPDSGFQRQLADAPRVTSSPPGSGSTLSGRMARRHCGLSRLVTMPFQPPGGCSFALRSVENASRSPSSIARPVIIGRLPREEAIRRVLPRDVPSTRCSRKPAVVG